MAHGQTMQDLKNAIAQFMLRIRNENWRALEELHENGDELLEEGWVIGAAA